MFCKTKMSREDRQKRKLKMYSFWEDTLEERLAGVKAAKAKLEEQTLYQVLSSYLYIKGLSKTQQILHSLLNNF